VSIRTSYYNGLTPSYELNTHAEATLSAAFKVAFEASLLKILEFNADARGIATLHGELDSFPALGQEKLYDNTIFNYGSCVDPHYLEYELGLSLSAHADAKFIFFSDDLFNGNYQTSNPFIIVSGCLIPKDTSDEKKSIYSKVFSVFGVHSGTIPFPDDVISVGLADEICKVMGWPEGSLKVTLEKSVQSSNEDNSKLPRSDESLSGVKFTLLPDTAMNSQQYSTKEQLDRKLADELNNENSRIYSGTVGRYFKGKFSNNEGSSSSSTSYPNVECDVNYKPVHGVCVPCSTGECCPGGNSPIISNCSQCSEDLTYCVSCNPGTKYVEVSSGKGTCEACGKDECCIGKNYIETCDTCNSDMTECSSCHSGYYLVDGACVKQRPSSGSRADMVWMTIVAFVVCALLL